MLTIVTYGGERVKSSTQLSFSRLSDGEKVNFGELCFSVIHTPGHTTGHIVYLLSGAPYEAPDSLFSGDHLFLGGIGEAPNVLMRITVWVQGLFFKCCKCFKFMIKFAGLY